MTVAPPRLPLVPSRTLIALGCLGWLGCGGTSASDPSASDPRGTRGGGSSGASGQGEGEKGNDVNGGDGAGDAAETPGSTDSDAATGGTKPSKGPPASKEDRKRFLAALDAGRVASKSGAYTEAIARFREALVVNPTNAAALGELGWAALKAGDLTLAETATAPAPRYADVDTQRASLLYNLGRVAEAREKKDVAIAYYRRSLELRDNDTVRERLKAIGGDAAAPPSLGLARVGSTFETLDSACSVLTAAKCSAPEAEGDTTTCSCAPTLEATQFGGEVGLLVFTVSDGPEERSWHPIFKTRSGWVLFDAAEWEYNPGALGIFEEIERVSGEVLGTLGEEGDAQQRFVRFSFSKSRRDSDMGICELELETHSLSVVCGARGDEVACTAPVLEAHSFTRELEREICDEETLRGLTEPPSQQKRTYTAEVSWTMTPVPALVVANVSTSGDPTIGFAYRPLMLPAKTYTFEELSR